LSVASTSHSTIVLWAICVMTRHQGRYHRHIGHPHQQKLSDSFYFFTNLIHLIFFLHLQSSVICLYMFWTNRSIIRRIKCLITQAASGTIPMVVNLSCVAVGVRQSNTNGHARQINDRENGARSCLCN
jgi:hypothetical protein